MFVLAILCLSGCATNTLPTPTLPTNVWVVPVQKVRAQFDIADVAKLELLKKLCLEFNRKLYNATDGQIRIAKFIIYSKGAIGEYEPGVANIYDGPGNAYAINVGTPINPQPFYTPLVRGIDVYYAAGTFLHEWLHAWIGVWDEYEVYEGMPSSCPTSSMTMACVMYQSWRTELCRASDHNPNTEHGRLRGMSCYEWLVKVCHDHGVAELQVPPEPISGPFNPPASEIEIKW